MIIDWFRSLFLKGKATDIKVNGMIDIITDLEAFDIGNEWPLKSQCKRLEKYNQLEEMLENKHDKFIRHNLKKIYPDDYEYEKVRIIKLDYYQATNEAFADLEYGEPPEFHADSLEKQTNLDKLIKQLDYYDVISCFDSDLKTYGNAILRLRRQDNKVYVDNINPRYWYPVVELLNYKNIIAHVIAFDYEIDDRKCLKVEIHKVGSVETKIFELKNGRINALMQEPVIEETGLEYNTIITAKLTPNNEQIYCDSSFHKYDTIVTAMEVELSKIGYNLDKQGKVIFGPQSALQRNQKTGHWEFKKESYLSLDKEDVTPGVLTFDAQITQSLSYINQLQEEYYIASGTSAALFSRDASNALSGVALKRLLQRPLSQATKLVNRIKPPLELALELASQLNSEKLNISSIWKDGLINDVTEDITNINSRINAGTISKQTAIQILDNVTQEKAAEELKVINEERKQESVTDLSSLYPQT